MQQLFAVCIGNGKLGLHSDQPLCGAIQFSIYANHICCQTYGIIAIVFTCFPFYVEFAYHILCLLILDLLGLSQGFLSK